MNSHIGEMRIACNPLICFAVLLNSIEFSSQSERSYDEDHPSASLQHSAESTARERSRSPILKKTFPSILGFRFEDLSLIRLRPHHNSNQIFELRKYVFPPNRTIRLRKNKFGQSAIPTGEQIVLSTSNGDVCAILDKKSCKHTILRAICTLAPGQQNRAKINMISGEVEEMTAEEIAACPVSTQEHVAKNYEVSRLSSPTPPPRSPGSSRTPAEPPVRDRTKSLTLEQKFPSVFGYRFGDLKFIRLAPHNHPDKIFELRVHAFSPKQPIGLRTKNHVLNPMPTGDQIVLSTPDGEIRAILLRSSNRASFLRPIFISTSGFSERVKINMSSGEVVEMTTEEIAECPGTAGEAITKIYRVFRV